MIAFAVSVNGDRVGTIGVGNSGVLHTIVRWSGIAGEPGDLSLDIGGLDKRTDEHIRWPYPPEMQVGDTITIQVIETDTVDPPIDRKTPAQLRQEHEEFLRNIGGRGSEVFFSKDIEMARVTGIGGVFLKCQGDPKALSQWYEQHLGLRLEPWGGSVLRWPDDTAEDKGLTVWNLAGADSKWFSPSTSSFMINYRVDDLVALLEQLRRAGIEILKGPESHENGKFAWIMDPDGNKVELWEPKLWNEKNKSV